MLTFFEVSHFLPSTIFQTSTHPSTSTKFFDAVPNSPTLSALKTSKLTLHLYPQPFRCCFYSTQAFMSQLLSFWDSIETTAAI
jgi:hypothetical protein